MHFLWKAQASWNIASFQRKEENRSKCTRGNKWGAATVFAWKLKVAITKREKDGRTVFSMLCSCYKHEHFNTLIIAYNRRGQRALPVVLCLFHYACSSEAQTEPVCGGSCYHTDFYLTFTSSLLQKGGYWFSGYQKILENGTNNVDFISGINQECHFKCH